MLNEMRVCGANYDDGYGCCQDVSLQNTGAVRGARSMEPENWDEATKCRKPQVICSSTMRYRLVVVQDDSEPAILLGIG